MKSKIVYLDIDKYACEWTENLIKAGEIPNGEVWCRSIASVKPRELSGVRQLHSFNGISGWPLALRIAGFPEDRECFTASLPCQPFSSAGKRRGFADKRHLWPTFFKLVKERMPESLFGEQVDSKDGRAWIARVQSDMESIGFAFGRASLNAAGVGASHIRQRLYWCAYRDGLALLAVVGRRGGVMEIRPGTTGKYKLRDEAPLAGWTTPQCHDTNPRGAGNRENPRGGSVLRVGRETGGMGEPDGEQDNAERRPDEEGRNAMGGVGKPYQNGEPVTTALTDQVKLAGWATPSVFLAAGDPEKVKKRREACAEKHGNNGFGLNLEQQAQAVTGWNTPRATDGTHGGPNQGGGRSRQTQPGLANTTSKRRRKARRNSDG